MIGQDRIDRDKKGYDTLRYLGIRNRRIEQVRIGLG